MEIKILCYRSPVCYAVWRVVQQAVRELSFLFPDVIIQTTMIKEPAEIIKYTHNLLLPSLVIKEKLVCAGYIPSREEVVAWLQLALATSGFQPVAMDR
jgi:hypothetical protein